jgi:aminoglycoside/choline kinase family phosphotransferase
MTEPTVAPSTQPVSWPSPERHAAFGRWLAGIGPRHGLQPHTLAPASADASFRRYLRLQGHGGSFIVMDAPPTHEDVRPFVQVAGLIGQAGLHGPQVLEADAEQGFLLLTDLGHELYLQALADGARADALMRDALAALLQWQQRVPGQGLPAYDEALLRRELALFPDWCVKHEFGVDWTDKQRAVWDRCCQLLVDSALAQPRVAVHRDWMPRNLMVCPGTGPPQVSGHAGHPGLPGRRAGPHHLRPGQPAARRLHQLGRGAGTRLGRALVAAGPCRRAAAGR